MRFCLTPQNLNQTLRWPFHLQIWQQHLPTAYCKPTLRWPFHLPPWQQHLPFNQHRGCNIHLCGLPSATYRHNCNSICHFAEHRGYNIYLCGYNLPHHHNGKTSTTGITSAYTIQWHNICHCCDQFTPLCP